MNVVTRISRVIAIAATIAVTCSSGYSAIKSQRMLGRIAQHTPAPMLVEHGQELKTAEKVASDVDGRAFFGLGQSMEPIYPARTAIVVRKLAYDEIKKGMTVVYRNRAGFLVAHVVVGEDRDGYIVQGANNEVPDAVSVNEKNMIGVVLAAYTANDTAGFHANLAKGGSRAVAAR